MGIDVVLDVQVAPADSLGDGFLEFVGVGDGIDQALLFGLFYRKRTLIDEGLHILDGLVAAFSDARDQAAREVVQQRVYLFPAALLTSAYCGGLRGSFIYRALRELGFDTDEVECLSEMHEPLQTAQPA